MAPEEQPLSGNSTMTEPPTSPTQRLARRCWSMLMGRLGQCSPS